VSGTSITRTIFSHHVVALHDVTQDHGEFVARVTRDGVRRAHAAAQAFGHRHQHRVADGMAERIVDVLEAIQIDEQHREHFAGAVRFLDRELESIVEQQTVRQTGQCILQTLRTSLLARATQFEFERETARDHAQRFDDEGIRRHRTSASEQHRAERVLALIAQR
jgi:hypothetical protein